jgi:hypothetical protein
VETKWIVFGVLGLGVLWFVFRKQQAGTVTGIDKTIAPPTRGDQIDQLASTLGSAGGGVVSKLLPGGSTIAKPLASFGSSYVRGTEQGFRTAGTGLTQIASGNVVTGTKNFVTGAAQTSWTAIGGKGVVDAFKSIF